MGASLVGIGRVEEDRKISGLPLHIVTIGLATRSRSASGRSALKLEKEVTGYRGAELVPSLHRSVELGFEVWILIKCGVHENPCRSFAREWGHVAISLISWAAIEGLAPVFLSASTAGQSQGHEARAEGERQETDEVQASAKRRAEFETKTEKHLVNPPDFLDVVL